MADNFQRQSYYLFGVATGVVFAVLNLWVGLGLLLVMTVLWILLAFACGYAWVGRPKGDRT